MKKLSYLISFALIFALVFSFCKKDNEEEEKQEVSNDEAAEVIANSLSSSSGGMNSQLSAVVIIVGTSVTSHKDANSDLCDFTGSKTFSLSSTDGALVQFFYSYNYEYGINCTGIIPTEFYFDITASGTVDAPRLESTDNITAHWSLTNLLTTDNFYILNGTLERTGNQTFKVRDKSFSSTVSITYADLNVKKTTGEISSGSASVSITGTGPNGGEFSYTGSITFNGENSVSLNLNGTTYTISIDDGSVS